MQKESDNLIIENTKELFNSFFAMQSARTEDRTVRSLNRWSQELLIGLGAWLRWRMGPPESNDGFIEFEAEASN